MKIKFNEKKFLVVVVVIVLAVLLYRYIGIFATLSDCRLGTLSSSYDSATDTYAVFGSIPLGRIGSDAGCVGFKEITSCVPIENKTVTSTGHCNIYDDWTGALILRYEYDINNDLPFDGCSVFFADSGAAWDQRECNFEVIVSPTAVILPNNITIYRIINNVCEPYIIPEGENLSTDYSSLSECQSNLIVCSSGDEKCSGQVSFNCINNVWTSMGYVDGKCNYTTIVNTTDETTIISEDEGIYDICTTEAKQCSDGSYVARNSSINCEFDACPVSIVSPNWWDDYKYTIIIVAALLLGFLWFKFRRKR